MELKIEKSKFLSLIAVGLLISNVLLLGYLFFGNRLNPNKIEPKFVIIKKLQFNPDQIVKYDILIADHRSKITTINKKINESKTALYETLKDSFNELKNDTLVDNLMAYMKEKESINLHHFEDIKALCTEPNQKQYFATLTTELAELFSPGKPKK